MMAPTDFSQAGQAAAMADPAGAAFCVWKGFNGDPPDVDKSRMGGWFWNELRTSDDRTALAFYETMFGFAHEAMNMGPVTYFMLNHGGRPRAGLCQSVNPAAKSMWLPYVAVPAFAAAAAKAAALGGEVVTAPGDIPGIGRFAIAVDPTGAAVAFITPKIS